MPVGPWSSWSFMANLGHLQPANWLSLFTSGNFIPWRLLKPLGIIPLPLCQTQTPSTNIGAQRLTQILDEKIPKYFDRSLYNNTYRPPSLFPKQHSTKLYLTSLLLMYIQADSSFCYLNKALWERQTKQTNKQQQENKEMVGLLLVRGSINFQEWD